MTVDALKAGVRMATVFAVAGMGFGWAYFTVLRKAVQLCCVGISALQMSALTLGRIAAAIGFFMWVGRWGAVPVLAALLGFFAMRTVGLRSRRGDRRITGRRLR